MGRRLEFLCHRNENLMVSNMKSRHTVVLLAGEINETTMSYYCTKRLAKMQRLTISSVGEDVEQVD